MSWNNVLPLWVYQVNYEHSIAEMQCCFHQEWYAGTSKLLPKHCIDISQATFHTHNEGEWNDCNNIPDWYDSLTK